MREIEICVSFSDCYGTKESDTITMCAEESWSESQLITWASDLATDWFYSVAEEECSIIWRERGGGTDLEYECFLDRYLYSCDFNWSFKKKWNRKRE